MRERSNRPGRKYAAIPNEAMRDKRLSAEARGLLALLMTYSDDWHFQRDHLMDLIGMGKDKFGKVMGELITHGYVEMVFTRDDKGHLLGKTWVIKDDATDVREMPTSDSTDVRETRRPVNPTSGESAHIRIPTGKNTNREEDLFGSNEPHSARKPHKPEDRFEEFWEAYPRKVAKDRAPKAWKLACKKADPDKIIAAAKRYAVLRAGEDEQFTAHASSWLNAGRFNDPDLQPAPVGTPVQRWTPGGVVR
jgi:hypothetical protein